MRLRRDLVLVKLAPPIERTVSGLILEPAMTPPVCYGKVVDVGRSVQDVQAGDIVAFPPSAGDALGDLFPVPHIVIPITEIDLVMERNA